MPVWQPARSASYRLSVLAVAVSLTFLVGVAAACAPSVPSAPPSPSQESAVPVPTDDTELSAADRCMLDSGFRITAIHEGTAGQRQWYSWAFNGPPGESATRFAECQELAPSPVDKTVAELRQIFDRWVKERDCLARLGYTPVPPPSFEAFVVGWKTTGPWMPVDGTDYTTWTTAEYNAVKLQCKLEAYER